MKYLISFVVASIILCCCVPKKATETDAVDISEIAYNATLSLTSLSNSLTTTNTKLTSLTTTVNTVKTDLATANTKITTLTTANTAKDKLLASQAAQLKSITDSLNAYKGALELDLFTKSNGVITINIATLKTRLGIK